MRTVLGFFLLVVVAELTPRSLDFLPDGLDESISHHLLSAVHLISTLRQPSPPATPSI